MMKIGIFGGSFDPIHKSHIDVIENSISQLGLDLLLVVPTKKNPWKAKSYASDEQRKAMIEIALKKIDKARLETIEIDSDLDDVNFTVDTLELLSNKYPDSEFHLIMGMDQASMFHKWHQAPKISRDVHLVCFLRLGYEYNENIDKFNFTILDMEPTSISSSDVRSGHLEYLQKRVLKYISREGIYLNTMIKPMMSLRRYQHTLSVAKLAVELAKANDIEQKQAYIASILHDITKEMDLKKELKIMQKHYSDKMALPHEVWHQYTGAYMAKKQFLVEDNKVIQAIEGHTTATTKMSKLDKLVYVADKLDPLREYDTSPQIALAKTDIDAAFVECLKDFYSFSKKKNRKIDNCFYDVYKKYVGEING
ncbi:MAG: nicotinate-nucleotide adenylyltransferase [Erysipelotrichaceae bacterium]|nr:nicotinate-nucleotide adenylyltransferase [Erysipelotrichaceae bacterium]